MAQHSPVTLTTCFHCGEDCSNNVVDAFEKHFCCDGCLMVYSILNEKGLCDYYSFTDQPGLKQTASRKNKFTFLDDDKIAGTLLLFKDKQQAHIQFYLPQIHCSSCLWLLENLNRINEHIISARVNFERKELTIVFDHHKVSVRSLAELLTTIGYEPYISLQDLQHHNPAPDRGKIFKLGVAGFCFANIMMMSFPEYLGIDSGDKSLLLYFRYLNVLLSLPVVFYSASAFYLPAWKSIRHKFLSIDAPIVLAVLVTFIRSLYEVITATGSGYFDSMSGIVFFMLAGRVLQDKTYQQLNFDRDFKSYFPLAATRIEKNGIETTVAISEIALNDTLLIHNEELIPADGILTRGHALIDYSFVTGESLPVLKEMGEIVYAGGKQTGSNIELLVIKPVTQSYLTDLWNKIDTKSKFRQQHSFVDIVSKYFTWAVFTIALTAGIYWQLHDSGKTWNAITAVLIVACPCALLLSNSFTNGIILRILGNNKFYLRNAGVIESIANADAIVFDKTGTLTSANEQNVCFTCLDSSLDEKNIKRKLTALAGQSIHPLSRMICSFMNEKKLPAVIAFKETRGKGIEGLVADDIVAIGTKAFVTGESCASMEEKGSAVYCAIEGKLVGKFTFSNHYRNDIEEMIRSVSKFESVSVISGDNDAEKKTLCKLFGTKTQLYFNQSPADKLDYIKKLQTENKKVMMVGDGLNDAGALMQSNPGIAVSEDANYFTPASDAILDASQLKHLHKFIRLCKANKKIVTTAFIISILYNLIGISFSISGNLSPMIAAILMPCSSISILLTSFGSVNYLSKKLGIK